MRKIFPIISFLVMFLSGFVSAMLFSLNKEISITSVLFWKFTFPSLNVWKCSLLKPSGFRVSCAEFDNQ